MMLAVTYSDSRDAVQHEFLAERVSTEPDGTLVFWRYGDVRMRIPAPDVVSIVPSNEEHEMMGGFL